MWIDQFSVRCLRFSVSSASSFSGIDDHADTNSSVSFTGHQAVNSVLIAYRWLVSLQHKPKVWQSECMLPASGLLCIMVHQPWASWWGSALQLCIHSSLPVVLLCTNGWDEYKKGTVMLLFIVPGTCSQDPATGFEDGPVYFISSPAVGLETHGTGWITHV